MYKRNVLQRELIMYYTELERKVIKPFGNIWSVKVKYSHVRADVHQRVANWKIIVKFTFLFLKKKKNSWLHHRGIKRAPIMTAFRDKCEFARYCQWIKLLASMYCSLATCKLPQRHRGNEECAPTLQSGSGTGNEKVAIDTNVYQLRACGV